MRSTCSSSSRRWIASRRASGSGSTRREEEEPMAGEDRRTDRAGDRAVYIISVAAELAGVHPQTLRINERKGLLQPARSRGNTRRYSERDIARLRAIQPLTQEQGITLAGAKRIT